MDMIPLMLISPVLVAVGYCDLRYMRIPDVLSFAAVAIFTGLALLYAPDDLVPRLATALFVFLAGFTAFAFRMVGGGDVKFLSALMLFIPAAKLAVFADVFSTSLIFGILLMAAVRRIPNSARLGWKSFSSSHRFPMGISIAMAGLVFPLIARTLG